jgi:hypothetical protein
MDGVTAMRGQWNDPAAIDNSTVTAMNGLAMDGSAMDGVMARQWMALRWCEGDGHHDGNGTLMEAQRQQQRWWMAWWWTARRWMARGLGYGWLNGNAKAMDSLMTRRWQWSNATAMDGSMATAMNGLATDGSAMDGAIAWQWTAWRWRNSNDWCDSNGTLM